MSRVAWIAGIAAALAGGVLLVFWILSPPREPVVLDTESVSAQSETVIPAPIDVAAEVEATKTEEAPAAATDVETDNVEETSPVATSRGAALNLVIRDRTGRRELSDVELRCIPCTWSVGDWEWPYDDHPATTLGTGLTSPIRIVPLRDSSGKHVLVRSLELRDARAEALVSKDLSEPLREGRGTAFYARSPGFAWGRIEVDALSGGERELLLDPATSLEIELSNVQAAAYEAAELDCILYVSRLDRTRHRVHQARVKESATAFSFPTLAPGQYRVSVELGDPYHHGPRPVLAEETVTLQATDRQRIVLTLADPPAPRIRASLSGTLAFPEIQGLRPVELWLLDSDSADDEVDRRIPLDAMTRVAGALATYRWDAGELLTGTYQAKIWPFQWSMPVELTEGGRDDVALVVDPVSRVVVTTIDPVTREPVPIPELFFRIEQYGPWMVDHVGETIAHDGTPGRFVFHAPYGLLNVALHDCPPELPYGSTRVELPVDSPEHIHELVLSPRLGIKVVFRDGEAELPKGSPLYRGLRAGIRRLDGEGRITMNRLATERMVELSAAGRYEVSFDGVDSGDYQPIPPVVVDVKPGEVAEVVIDLVRR